MVGGIWKCPDSDGEDLHADASRVRLLLVILMVLYEWLLVAVNLLLVFVTCLLVYSTHQQAKAAQRQAGLAEAAERRELDRYKPKLMIELTESQTVDAQGSFLKFQGFRVVNTGSSRVLVNYAGFVPAVPEDAKYYKPLDVERVVQDRGSRLSYNDDLPTLLEPGEDLVRMYGQIDLVKRLNSTRVQPVCVDSLRNFYRGEMWTEFIGEVDSKEHASPGNGMREQKGELLPSMELPKPRTEA